MATNKTYTSWYAMIGRCNNKKKECWKNYGGRGITVCDRWKKFENFIEDMGDRPAGKSLDRIDNNGNYCKENCKWSTDKEQANNRRNNIVIKIKNKTYLISELSEKFNIPRSLIASRIRYGWDSDKLFIEKSKDKYRDIFIPPMFTKNEKIIHMRKNGWSFEKIATHFECSKQNIFSIVKRIANKN